MILFLKEEKLYIPARPYVKKLFFPKPGCYSKSVFLITGNSFFYLAMPKCKEMFLSIIRDALAAALDHCPDALTKRAYDQD